MSYQYHERGGPQGIPDYDYPPQPQRRMPPPKDQYGSDPRRQQRGPPPMRPRHPGGGAPRGGYPQRPPPPQQYSRPPPMDQDEGLYDGSAYGGAEYEQSDSWPLPAPAFAQQSRPRSPGSPGASKGQRRPPQRPQRPDYQEPVGDSPRSMGRGGPDPRGYQRGPPPSRSQHHGDGQWNGEGYSSPQSNYAPQGFQRPPPMQAPIQDYQDEYAPENFHLPSPRDSSQQRMADPGLQPPPQQSFRQANPRPPLGPPPSARRGPASYYPQIAPVHPIVEETDSFRASIKNASMIAPSHSSYASSNAIQIGIPDYYLEERNSMLPPPQQEDTERPGDESPVDPSIDGGRDSRNTERTGPSPEPAALMRQASLGKMSKPTLMTVKSAESAKKENMPQGLARLPSQQLSKQRQQQQQQRALVDGAPNDYLPVDEKQQWPPRVGPPARPSYEEDDDYRPDSYENNLYPVPDDSKGYPDDLFRKPSVKRRSSDILSSNAGFMEAEESDDSEKEFERKHALQMPREPERALHKAPSKELLTVGAALAKEQQHRPRSRSPLAPHVDPRVERIVGGLEKGGALTAEEAEQLKQQRQMPQAAAGASDGHRRRPPKLQLEMDKVRDAEARGSLTSLPDLIRRATKVASNLDRGKTASRLGMGFFENSSQTDMDRMRALDRANRRSNGSGMSDMLSSFPPPRGTNMQRWSSNLRHNVLPSTSDAGEGKKKGRRCCGMPLWAFLVLLAILLCLIAAAVVVPVVLVVLPNDDESSLAKRCANDLTCAHGGVAIADAGATGNADSDGVGDCRCLCVGGYTGSRCQDYSPAACTMTAIGDADDATVGNGVPEVLRSAQVFGLDLDGQTLLRLFSREGLTCQAQNALVTFSDGDGSEKRSAATPTIYLRDPLLTPSAAPARTSNGLVIAASRTASPGTAASAQPSEVSNVSSDPDSFHDRATFAGAAVLYILQTSSSLEQASTAQTSLQNFFGKRSNNDDSVTLEGGWTADFETLRLRGASGTVSARL